MFGLVRRKHFNQVIEQANENMVNTANLMTETILRLERHEEFLVLLTQVCKQQAPSSFNDLIKGVNVVSDEAIKETLYNGK